MLCMMKNMNVYTVIYEQQRDKAYDDMQEALHKAQDTNERVRDILPLSYHNPRLVYVLNLRLVMISTKNPHFSAGVRHEVKGKTSCNLYETSSVSLHTNHITLLCICQWGWVLKSMPIKGTFC